MREEEKKQPSRKLGVQRFFKKRWVYPAIYIGAAAIILASFLWFQNGANENADPDDFGYDLNPDRSADDEAAEVTNPLENFKWPVPSVDNMEVKTPFYDAAASAEEQEAAILTYGNSFQPNTGLAIVAKDGESFEVVAAMSGTVKSVDQDTVLGNVVVVEHGDGIETRYQSLNDIKVKEGDKVSQGQVLAKAGKSLLNEDAGVHVHFEIRKNDVPVNPLEFFGKTLSSLQEADVEESENVTEDETENTEEAGDEENTDEQEDANEEDTNDANDQSDAS